MSGDAKEALKLFVAELVKDRPDQKSADKAYRGILFEFREEYLKAFAAQTAPTPAVPTEGE